MFNGISFNDNIKGEGWGNYLLYLNALSNGVDLDTDINEIFSEAIEAIENLEDDLMNQIINTTPICEDVRLAYDKVQRGTVLLKTDMLGYLNIDVDYLDADGD